MYGDNPRILEKMTNDDSLRVELLREHELNRTWRFSFKKHNSVLGIVCPLVCCTTCEVWCGRKGEQMLYPGKSSIYLPQNWSWDFPLLPHKSFRGIIKSPLVYEGAKLTKEYTSRFSWDFCKHCRGNWPVKAVFSETCKIPYSIC